MARRVHPVAGKVVLITGAAHGIGAETARRLASRGARLALVDIDGPALDVVAEECRAAWRAQADVTDDARLREAVAAAAHDLGGIDVAIVNAGVAAPGLLRFARPGTAEQTIGVNLLGAWRTLDAALPHLIARRGYALCVGSVAAVAHVPSLAAYSASKAGLEALTDALRLEVSHLGVDVGMAYLSWIATSMVTGGGAARPRTGSLAMPPLHRVYPVTDAGRALVDAVEHRRPAVFHPRWLRAALPARGLLPPVLGRALPAAVARMDASAQRRAVARRDAAAAADEQPGGQPPSAR